MMIALAVAPGKEKANVSSMTCLFILSCFKSGKMEKVRERSNSLAGQLRDRLLSSSLAVGIATYNHKTIVTSETCSFLLLGCETIMLLHTTQRWKDYNKAAEMIYLRKHERSGGCVNTDRRLDNL